MRRRRMLEGLVGGLLCAPAVLRSARAAEPVDVELVLAVDVSRSVDHDEQEMQMRGYAAAFRDPKLIEGISRGAIGAIACTLFTWSDWNIQEDLVPWMQISDTVSAERFARALDSAPRRNYLYTSISGAMDYASRLYGQGFEGTRKVLDISGDGVNNSGRPVSIARQEALAQDIIINGLAVLDRTPPPTSLALSQPPLDDYYRDEVIGGPGSFLMVAEGFEAFEHAVRRKIIREVAGLGGPGVERATA
ncbi:DUF1194 domain-containing protein [Roseomonas sp. OT10]|uniref:DUF1194 domain-containing protein n=1 Tax=Roseomonas cutis TaxID=2897332 RepID=UPI001E3062A5|nr:DUF1194 domain-containing protein [Roseomonas sp. OT10]UFN51053.1 DUF1194 domain-containing protein [Roseomonas sp. OT10]